MRNFKLRVHSKPDRNQSKLTVCIGLQCMVITFSLRFPHFFFPSFCNHEIRFSNFNENILEVLELSPWVNWKFYYFLEVGRLLFTEYFAHVFKTVEIMTRFHFVCYARRYSKMCVFFYFR